jgi:hypothetical protein
MRFPAGGVAVGPNAVNLRETSVLSTPYEFRVEAAAGLLLCSWTYVPDGACPKRSSSCDIPAGLLEIGGLVWGASYVAHRIVHTLPK